MTPSDAALLKLTTWLSPAYPVGAYSYSHGLEWAVGAGEVVDRDGLGEWVGACLTQGSGRNDAILLAHAWRAQRAGQTDELAEVVELAAALAPSAERRLETLNQGQAFKRVSEAAWPAPVRLSGEIAYPVAVGTFAAAHGCPLRQTLLLYLQAFVANLVSAGIRLIPLGQTDGQRTIAELLSAVHDTAEEALDASLEDLGGSVLRSDLASMRHETQYTRLFRS